MKSILGYKTEYSLNQGLRLTYQWYKKKKENGIV